MAATLAYNREAQKRRRLRSDAREIDRAYMRRRRLDPVFAEQEARRAWQEKRQRWNLVALRQLRWRAKRTGLECTISPEDLILPSVCPVLGIPLIISDQRVRFLQSPNSPSVDRLDNRAGYIPRNVRVISLRANVLKRDATTEEIRRLLKWMEEEGAP